MEHALLRGLLGLAFFCVISWLLSSHKRRFPWRVVVFGLVMQFVLAWLILRTTAGENAFQAAADVVVHLVGLNVEGTQLVFGKLADPGSELGFIFAFAGTGLVVIIMFSALMAILYHLGLMQLLVWALAKVMSTVLRVSGAESMAMAANVFVGQTEAPLVVKPYIPGMTRSELNALMTGGFATIAGSVLAVYIGVIGPEYGPHLLTASVLSAPAAFLIAKIMLPETEVSATGANVRLRVDREAHNVIEAAANGTADGLKLWLNVIAMLIAFKALVNVIDWPLGALGEWMGRWLEGFDGELSLARLFGWVFAPVAWLMGVEGWHDSQTFGSLLGTKIAVNEFIAFDNLRALLLADPIGEVGAGAFEHKRSAQMAAYALCGFANFASVGIQIGGIAPLAPDRKRDLSELALRAMLGGAFASWMTATVAGMFLA